MSFRREKYVPKGGPDGGDGGKGASVILQPTPHLNSLADFHTNQKFQAPNGRPGEGSNCTGRDGKDLVLQVPIGTVVRDRDRGNILKDLVDETPFVVVDGGRGGRGNTRFSSSTNRVPRQFEKGHEGQERWITLELKLIADIGLVGMPNAGKSTFLSRVSRARPKIAPYPFTTLVPNLGIVEMGYGAVVIADIPGLIEGAHEGQGLGDQFLRHIERTRILLHLIDGADDSVDPVDIYKKIRRELELYSKDIASKPEVIAITKGDAIADRDELAERCAGLPGPWTIISSTSGEGIQDLVRTLTRRVEDLELEGSG